MNVPSVEKKWYICPRCGSKIVLYDNTANCQGVFVKCSRGCRNEIEILIQNGEQVWPSASNR